MESKLYSLLPKVLEKNDSSYQTVEELFYVLLVQVKVLFFKL